MLSSKTSEKSRRTGWKREISLRHRLPQRQLVQPVKIKLAHQHRLLQLALRGLARMQLPEPAHRHALRRHPRRAIRMQPLRRQPGLGREAVKVHSSRLEPRQHLLHRALHVMKFNGPRRMQRPLLRQAAHRAEGQRRPLLHLLRTSR